MAPRPGPGPAPALRGAGRGAVTAVLYLGFAVLGLVLCLGRPANPIGWLLAVVDRTMQPTRASLWLRPAGPP